MIEVNSQNIEDLGLFPYRTIETTKLIENLQAYVDKGFNYLEVNPEFDRHGCSFDIWVIEGREETEEELKQRLEESTYQRYLSAKQTYEFLKDKYE